MKVIFTCLFTLLTAFPAAARDIDPQILQELEMTRSLKEKQRGDLVAQHMRLTQEQSNAFWPVYHSYRTKTGKINDKLQKLIVAYARSYGETISDAKASKMLKQWLQLEEKRLQLKKEYVPKFKKILPALQVTRFYQVDNKLEVILKLGIAKEVPLIGDSSQPQ